MDHYITPAELILLLSISWGPVFAIAALAQWRYILRPTAAPVAIWLSAALILEITLASAIWIAPLHGLFLSLDKFPDGLEIVSLPFQAGLLAAFIVTGCFWVVGQRYRVCHLRSDPDRGDSAGGRRKSRLDPFSRFTGK